MDEAAKSVTDAALSGNPVALLIAIAACIYVIDKAWFHGNRLKEKHNGSSEPTGVRPCKDVQNLAEQMKLVAQANQRLAETNRESLEILRAIQQTQAIMMDRMDRV